MHSKENPAPLRACDAVAVAMEDHLRNLQADGHGDLRVERVENGVRLAFGNIEVRAENYDIALVRIGGALLDDGRLGDHFLARLRAGVIPRLIRRES